MSEPVRPSISPGHNLAESIDDWSAVLIGWVILWDDLVSRVGVVHSGVIFRHKHSVSLLARALHSAGVPFEGGISTVMQQRTAQRDGSKGWTDYDIHIFLNSLPQPTNKNRGSRPVLRCGQDMYALVSTLQRVTRLC